MVKVKKTVFMSVKDCVSISANGVEAIVTTEFGPRILSYTLNGKENHMAVFPEHIKGKEDVFYGYGGHRVWHAPEVGGRTNLPENDPCIYELTESGVRVLSKNPDTKITKGFAVSMDEQGVLTVDNLVSNDGLFDIELSIWGITQFALGGVMAVPQSSLDTGFVANRTVTLWPYSATTDSRVYYGDRFITVKPDKSMSHPFKFGTNCDEQYACYFNHNQMVLKEFPHYYDADYPNFYCNFESYVNGDFIEIEALSPMFTLEAGETEVFTEKWRIFDGVECPDAKDEKKIAEVIEKLTK